MSRAFEMTQCRKNRWYLYIAQCGDRSLYTGITTDLEERLRQHNAGRGSKYVQSKGGAKMVYTELHATNASAQRRELEIKSWSRMKKLRLISQATQRTISPA